VKKKKKQRRRRSGGTDLFRLCTRTVESAEMVMAPLQP
jgi:hypothetical protein